VKAKSNGLQFQFIVGELNVHFAQTGRRIINDMDLEWAIDFNDSKFY